MRVTTYKMRVKLIVIGFIYCLSCIGQHVVKYGDKRYMIEKVTDSPLNFYEKYFLNKNLKDGIYIILHKKDTVAIINLKNHLLDSTQVYYQLVNNRSEKYMIQFYDKGELKKITGFAGSNLISYTTHYSNGLKNGEETFYSGNLVTRKALYKNDSLQEWSIYYKNGLIKAEGFGDVGYRSRNLVEYAENGVIKSLIGFFEGRPVNMVKFDQSGLVKEIGCIGIYDEDIKEGYGRGMQQYGNIENKNKCETILFESGKRK